MKELLLSLNGARLYCREKAPKKTGINTFSKYDYFTPEQIFGLTSEAEEKNGLISTFDLIPHDQQVLGLLTIYHIESGGKLEFKMLTSIPEIKATNSTQQLGGAVTYTHRYLLTTAYKIAENHLDFDADQQKTEKNQKSDQIWLNEFTKEFKESWFAIHQDRAIDLKTLLQMYKISKENQAKINAKDYFLTLSNADKKKYQYTEAEILFLNSLK